MLAATWYLLVLLDRRDDMLLTILSHVVLLSAVDQSGCSQGNDHTRSII